MTSWTSLDGRLEFFPKMVESLDVAGGNTTNVLQDLGFMMSPMFGGCSKCKCFRDIVVKMYIKWK